MHAASLGLLALLGGRSDGNGSPSWGPCCVGLQGDQTQLQWKLLLPSGMVRSCCSGGICCGSCGRGAFRSLLLKNSVDC